MIGTLQLTHSSPAGRLRCILISHFYLNLRESASPAAGASASSPSQMSGSLQFGRIVGELGSTSLGFDQPAAEDDDEDELSEVDGDEGVDVEEKQVLSGPVEDTREVSSSSLIEGGMFTMQTVL